MKAILLLVLTAAVGLPIVESAEAQTRKEFRHEISGIDSEYHGQAGFNMATSLQYEADMDSLLNEVYQVLQASNTSREQAALRSEERQWIQKRDALFKKDQDRLNHRFPRSMPHDEQMIVWDKDAAFIRARVLNLIDRLET